MFRKKEEWFRFLKRRAKLSPNKNQEKLTRFSTSSKDKRPEKQFPNHKQMKRKFLKRRHQEIKKDRKISTLHSCQQFMQNKIKTKISDHAFYKFVYAWKTQFLIFKTLIDSKESLITLNKSYSSLFTIAYNLLSFIIFFAIANTSSTPLN